MGGCLSSRQREQGEKKNTTHPPSYESPHDPTRGSGERAEATMPPPSYHESSGEVPQASKATYDEPKAKALSQCPTAVIPRFDKV